jgi:hypothetical protein
MRRIRVASILILFVIASGLNANGQCKAFAKKTCLPELGSYIHDGNYHATVLSEGEEAELYKTFYSDMEYRLAICGDEAIPPVEFTVIDADKNILFSSKQSNNVRTWDFKLESSQQLRILIRVGSTGTQGGTPASGCVAVMFGFKIKS